MASAAGAGRIAGATATARAARTVGHDAGFVGGRLPGCGEQREQGGLAGTVRAGQPEHVARADHDIEPGEQGACPVRRRQPADSQRRRHSPSIQPAPSPMLRRVPPVPCA